MKDRIKSKAISASNHIYKHRAKYAAGATLAVCIYVQRGITKDWYEFLEEKGIDKNEFLHCPEDYEYLMQNS